MASTTPLFREALKLGEGLGSLPGRYQALQHVFRRIHLNRLIEEIAWNKNRVVTVCDGSAFRRENPALAARILDATNVVIAPSVLPELEALRLDPTAEELTDIVFPGGQLSSRIIVVSPPDDLAIVARRYARLLSARKYAFLIEVRLFERENARPPTRDEERAMAERLGTRWGPRTASLALKFAHGARQPIPKKPSSADEDTVVLALLLALTNRKDTVVLTDDLDLHEQFYKLTMLVRDDYAAYLANQERIHRPDRYSIPTPIPNLDPAIGNPALSFMVRRPQRNLSYLFRNQATRGITVARIRDSGEYTAWIATEGMVDFLRQKNVSGTNAHSEAKLNCYIHIPGLDPPHQHLFFVADQHLPQAAEETEAERVSIVEYATTMIDSESFDIPSLAKEVYERAVGLHKKGRDADAARLIDRLQAIARGKQHRGTIPALGHAQASFASAAYRSKASPKRAAAIYASLIDEFRDAKSIELLRNRVSAQVNQSQALLSSNELASAFAVADEVEREHALSSDLELRAAALAASWNRTMAVLGAWHHRSVDLRRDARDVIAAYHRTLIHLGFPPTNALAYVGASFGLALVLIECRDMEALRRLTGELFRLAQSDLRHRKNCLATIAEIAVSLARKRFGNIAHHLLHRVEEFVLREGVSVSDFQEIADPFGRVLASVSFSAAISSRARIVTPCERCPPSLRARRLLFNASISAARSGPSANLLAFREALTICHTLPKTDDVAEVVRLLERRLNVNHPQALIVVIPKPEPIRQSSKQLQWQLPSLVEFYRGANAPSREGQRTA